MAGPLTLNLIERTDPDASARSNAFTLTKSGAALRPILEGLADWSHTYLKEFRGGTTSIRLRMWIKEPPNGGSVF